jgi:hypothetical protein
LGPTTFVNAGRNLNNAGVCGLNTGEPPVADLLLGSLGANGGPTETIPLLPGSPAIDAGDAQLCPPADQRGVVRPMGARCDIGAFEFEPPVTVSHPLPVAAPAPVPPPGQASPPRPFHGVRLSAAVLATGGKVVIVPVFCPVGHCTGTLVLRHGRKLGAARFSIAEGRTAHIRVRLTTRARRLLAKKHRLTAIMSASASSNGTTRSATRKVTLKVKHRTHPST